MGLVRTKLRVMFLKDCRMSTQKTCLGSASDRFRVPIGETNKALRHLDVSPVVRDSNAKACLHLRDRIHEGTVSGQRRFQSVWFWSRDTLKECDTHPSIGTLAPTWERH